MPKILVLNDFYRPDRSTNSSHLSNLCQGLASRGAEPSTSAQWEVEVWPSNRSQDDPTTYPTKPETLDGQRIRRVWRPPLSSASFPGCFLNSIWMMKAWWLRLFFAPKVQPDIILLGPDPYFSVLLAPWLKLVRPKAKVVHWCLKLFPEAAIAEKVLSDQGPLTGFLRSRLGKAYAACDLVGDLGSCMVRRLRRYPIQRTATLTPWALTELLKPAPPDLSERRELFGESKLALLYSGNLGKAHDFYLTIKLAQLMKDTATFCYSAWGSRLDELKKAHNPEYTNIRFAGHAQPEKLVTRLTAPDVHIVSLRPEWTGVAVPSKFFGALAMGRPVLFEGSPDSAIAKWIEEHKVGWVLRPDNLQDISKQLLKFSGSSSAKAAMFNRCFETYQEHFSRARSIEDWDKELRSLLG